MKRYFYVLTLACVIAFTTATSFGQQPRRARARAAANAQTTTSAALLSTLPASDAVLSVDVRRLLNEALPRAYSNNPSELARVNAEIAELKTRTGLDARSFERLAIGISYKETAAGKTLVETVAIARGSFNAATVIAAARAGSNKTMQEQKYAGKSIYVFSVNEQVRLLGLFKLRVTDLAVAVLNQNTLAIGKLERVQAAIDASAGRGGRVSKDITALATHDTSAIIGAGGNIPASLTQNLDIGNLSKSIASVRQFYSTFGLTANGFNMLTALRTDSAVAAKSLTTTIAGLKQLAPFAIGQMPAARAQPLRSLVENTKVNSEGNDVLISLELAQVDVAALIDAF